MLRDSARPLRISRQRDPEPAPIALDRFDLVERSRQALIVRGEGSWIQLHGMNRRSPHRRHRASTFPNSVLAEALAI